MNGDECMALGAAFHAANMSHSFKVRPIQLTDGFSFEMQMEITDDKGYNKNFTLFPYKKRYGAKKSIAFNHDENLKIEIFLVSPEVMNFLLNFHKSKKSLSL
jgi:hypoxia up-regulated 1